MRKSSSKRAARNVAATETAANALVVTETAATPVTLETVSSDELTSGTTIDNATGENVDNSTASTEAPADNATENTSAAIEATPDPRVARAERIAADRIVVRNLYKHFEANRLSVPVKALSAFKLAPSSAHPVTRGATQRQAAAIAIGLAAAGAKLADGAQFARVFEIDGVNSAIENGVLRDALSAGLVRLVTDKASPEAEIFAVAKKAAATISGLLGSSILKAAKLA